MAGRSYMNVDAARVGLVNNVAVATTSTAVASAAFGSETHQIRIAASANCYFKIDQAPTAAVTDVFLPLNWVEYLLVTPGQKISVFSPTIQTISVVEITQ